MGKHVEAGLRSDGELVQAGDDQFDFATPREQAGLLLPAVQEGYVGNRLPPEDEDGAGGIEVLRVEPPTAPGDGDDDGLPDTIIWCIAGDGEGAAGDDRDHVDLAYSIADKTWTLDGEAADGAGLGALLLL